MNTRRSIFAMLLWAAAASPSLAITYTTLDFPGGNNTYAVGISGGNIVGAYYDPSNVSHGFLYNGTTYTTIDYPGSTTTELSGIDGNNIVGDHSGHGFLYNGSTYTTLNDPLGTQDTRPLGRAIER